MWEDVHCPVPKEIVHPSDDHSMNGWDVYHVTEVQNAASINDSIQCVSTREKHGLQPSVLEPRKKLKARKRHEFPIPRLVDPR